MKRAAINLYKRLLVRKALYPFHRALLNIGLWGVGALNSEHARFSGEDAFLRHLNRYLPSVANLMVWDVGAHAGAYAVIVKQRYPTARVYAFEPHPATFQRLASVARTYHIFPLELALGETPGAGILYDRAGNGSTHASLHREVVESIHRTTATAHAITVTTVDRLARSLGIAHIDLLKIDAEGGELGILRGAGALIAAGAIDAIQFEFNEMNIVSRAFLRDFAELLPDYDLYRMLPDGLVLLRDQPAFLREIFAYQNIVALRRRPSRRQP